MTLYLMNKNNYIVLTVFFIVSISFDAQARNEFAIKPISYPNILKNYEKIMLGKALFDDTILFDNGKSCSGCHQFSQSGTFPSSLGHPSQQRPINVPTVFNTGLNFRWHWDGLYNSLDEHLNRTIKVESSSPNQAWKTVLIRIEQDSVYQKKFDSIYGEVNRKNVIDAIVEYEKALVTPSPFDDYLKGRGKLNERAIRGFEKFQQFGCISCHQGKNIGGNLIAPIGVINDFFEQKSELKEIDYGYYNVTGLERHKFHFKVPSLRNVAKTAPYFHDGSIATLDGAVRTMGLYQLGLLLEDEDVIDLVSFLESLSGTPLPELMD